MTSELPPYSQEPEHAVLGSMLLSPTDIIPLVNLLLSVDDFRFDAERIIWRAINALHSAQRPVDIVTLAAELRNTGKLDAVGGPAFVTHLYTFTPTAANAGYYASIVRDHSKAFKMWQTCRQIADRCLQPIREGHLNALCADLSRLSTDLNTRTADGFKSMRQHVSDALDRYEENAAREGLPQNVYPTGIVKLDAELEGGLMLGEYVVLSAVTSGGKSALAAGNIALHFGIDLASRVAIYSYEMTAASLVDRMVSQRASISNSKLRRGKLSEMDFQALTRQIDKLSSAGIFIRDRINRWTVDDVANDARALKGRDGLHLVVVDYLQLVSSRSYGKQREREVAEISRLLLSLARELNIVVIALSQLNDDGALRESRAIGHDADVVMTIEDAYDKGCETPLENQRNMRINKNRNGPRDKCVRVNWFPTLTRFE